MTITRTHKILGLAALTAVLMTPAAAQGVDAALDTNGDGMMSFPELQAGYPDLTEEEFTAMDQTGDGLLDVVEIGDAINAGMLAPSEG